MANKNALTVPGRYDQVRKIVAFVANGAEKAGLNEDAVFHVELCCDEACTNIIEHAYGGEDIGPITVSYDVHPDAFQITIQDDGRTFDPTLVPPPPLSPPPDPDIDPENLADELQIGGLGIHFMRKLMDEVQFNFNANGKNTLIMVKKLPQGGVS